MTFREYLNVQRSDVVYWKDVKCKVLSKHLGYLKVIIVSPDLFQGYEYKLSTARITGSGGPSDRFTRFYKYLSINEEENHYE